MVATSQIEAGVSNMQPMISYTKSSNSSTTSLSSKSSRNSLPPLTSILSLHDFTAVAKSHLRPKTYAFYSSAATDEISLRANRQCLDELLLRPRVLRDVSSASTKTAMLGCKADLPFYLSPVALAKLAHEDGEIGFAKGCMGKGIPYIISNNASYSLEEIVTSVPPRQPLFMQLYVNTDRKITASLLKQAKPLGIKGIFVTIDAPVPGKREADERIPAENVTSAMSGAVAVNDSQGGGLGRLMARYIDTSLVWDDIEWIKRVSGLPVVLKGIQCAEDAKRACEIGVQGVVLSNHGGRSLDTVQPGIMTLLEMHKACPEVFGKMEIFVDGGISRGTDVLKCLALGATAVGLGRPFLYSLVYGQEGVERLIDILKDELITAMKLCGITSLDQVHPGMVNTSRLESFVQYGETHPWIQWMPKAKL